MCPWTDIANCDGVISKTWSSCKKFRKVCYLYSGCTETLSRWARVNTHCAAMKRCKRLFGRFTTERTLGKKVSVLNSRAARLPVRYFRQRQRTSSFFSRAIEQMSDVHASHYVARDVFRGQKSRRRHRRSSRQKLRFSRHRSHLARHVSGQNSLRYTTSTCQQTKKSP